MITIEEISVERIEDFWSIHYKYLVADEIITDEEDKEYFQSEEYRGVIKSHMLRDVDKHHMVYFVENERRIGAAQYNTYQSEDGKCFILDFWVFPEYRGNGTGHRCFAALEAYTKADGAKYYEINCERENAHRFWQDNGFLDNGVDEYGMMLMVKRAENDTHYIHPESRKIKAFIKKLELERLSLECVVEKIFEWFDENISYSRLEAPYFPLQRSDLDVLKMKAGTCGDYSNLIVSVLTSLGYQAQYAYLKTDCYGNPQDHICAAVWEDERWKLVDATLPYRKWHGFDCPHQEYDILSPQAFEKKMKQEENFWLERARSWGNERYAGLLYAPWIHEEIVVDTEEVLETVFFLALLDESKNFQIYINYLIYLEKDACTPIMCRVCGEEQYYCFSTKGAKHLWDDEQWSEEYLQCEVPEERQNERFGKMRNCIDKIVPQINRIVEELESEQECRL